MRRPTCAEASSLFTRFLEDWNGRLPGRWRLDVKTATFFKSPHVGFRVKRAVGPDPNPNHGGRHPSGTGKRCPATFRVLHNDRIGRLKLPQGNYRITRLSKRSPSCTRASKLFARFLQHPQGDLPGRWRVDRQSASFTKGRTNNGFRVKLVR